MQTKPVNYLEVDKEAEEDQQFRTEMRQLGEEMKERNYSRTQDAMGESFTIKKVHTKEMSKIFKSKRELY